MENAIQTSSQWAALILVGTTCVVLIYLVIVLASIFRGDRHVKSVLKIGSEEYVLEMKQGQQYKFKHHKWFWIGVGAAYAVAVVMTVWYILMIVMVLIVGSKVLGKINTKKA
ncbi:hypothetical protein [Laceyella putida]|uniref:DUF3784 domain-containing protein n=1 Tax=Laceyella putida TaxID=110101 RepID=A0ABW2RQD0_9BACL